MKKLILILVAVVISHTTVFSQACLPDSASAQIRQGCLPEGITFETQAQIDSFPINYRGCTQIEGGVMIYDGGTITNLNGLNNLISINGDLWINRSALENLTGLNNLSTIGGTLRIGYPWVSTNPLSSLTGLEGLTSIAGDLIIENNDALYSLDGLENLISIGSGLSITNNNFLNSIVALSNLKNINGSIIIRGNSMLPNLTGLENIGAASVNYLEISNNSSLTSCSVQSICNYLANLNGIILIAGNSTGCNSPPEVAAGCGIAFSCLPYGDYWFFCQTDIDNFQTLYPGCIQLEGNVIIGGNGIIAGSDITNLNGFSLVTSIGGNLIINRCNSLINLTGLNNVTTIGGSLTIGQPWQDWGIDALISLTGLEGLASIGGDFSIWNSDSLTSLTGLEGLTSIGGNLNIDYDTALTSLIGLENLTSIGGGFEISYNDALTSLTGLENIDAGSIHELYITGNTSLSTCEVESVCNYLAIPNGNINIWDNAPGCDSPEEVEAACNEVSAESIDFEDDYLLFPNPTGKTVTISGNNDAPIREIFVYNQTGQKVLQGKPVNKTLDISKLQPGMYIVELVAEHLNIRKKLIIE